MPHNLTIRTDDEDLVTETRHEDHHLAAEEAMQQRIRRLRDAKTGYKRHGNQIVYTDSAGVHVTLTYEDAS
ncbi:hypothetical protein [Zhihengliuella flava]|uniref:Ribosome-associated translation inhibitor RaiA n=1 Tax=Zhihengliuella flava TaxID=1285193 RepID=A0A931D7F5_9MICC|nr:hypothetical protein [Zhihengliuella flava]MBG6085844.1 ribosome-associated translation inhibitor RaiA [Zhihengliuella flava]